MIITINDKQEVIAEYNGLGINSDGVMSFEVEKIPARETGKILCFDVETETFYSKAREPVDTEAIKAARAKEAERSAARKKKAAALNWLADNDWKVNKIVLGEWSSEDERWIEYLAGRGAARLAIDEADAVLNS
jgi:hypothetical protein